MLILKTNRFLNVLLYGILAFNLVRVHITLLLPYSINNDGHNPVCLTE